MNFSFGILIASALVALPLSTQAQYIYATNNSAITITGYTGPGGAVDIPNTITGLPVTSIGDYAFLFSTNLTVITIPSGVTNIGHDTFDGCTNLTTATIPATLKTIGASAFFQCSSLDTLTIPNGVSSIGSQAFRGCSNLVNLTIGNSVTSISIAAFANCTKLPSVTIPSSLTRVWYHLFQYCSSLTNVIIPQGVLSLDENAFEYCTSLARIIIPASVTNIGTGTFGGCSTLTAIYFQGNAPTAPFAFDPGLTQTVYYLPGTTGWTSTLGGQPTVLWNPQFQTADLTFGLHDNQFAFTVTGTANIPIALEASTSLATPAWTALQTCVALRGFPWRYWKVEPCSKQRGWKITS